MISTSEKPTSPTMTGRRRARPRSETQTERSAWNLPQPASCARVTLFLVILPSWNELIGEMAEQLEYDPAVFQSQGGYLELAEFYKIKKTSMGSLRSWMDRTWHTEEARIDNCPIYRSIVGLMTGPIFCTKWSVSVTPLSTFVRSRRRGRGDVGKAERFPYLHAPVVAAR